MRPLHIPSASLATLAELAAFLAAFFVAVVLRFGLPFDNPLLLVLKALVTSALIVACLSYADLYEGFGYRRRLEEALRIIQSLLVALLLLALVYWTFPALKVGRAILAIQFALGGAVVLVWRQLRLSAAGTDVLGDAVLILGTGRSAQQIAREMLAKPGLGLRVSGFLGENAVEVGRRIVNPAVIGTLDDLSEMVTRHRISVIVTALEDSRGRMPIEELLRHRMSGVRVYEATTLFELLTGRILLNSIRPSWLVFAPGFVRPRLYQATKRALELVLASIACIVVLPVLAIVALLVKLTSRGPILFRQERVGEGGRLFVLYKFRTMRVDAESESGPVWAARDGDSRVTPLGGLLRKLRLDELPQLFNVLKGEMSLVGPRPERPHFVERLRSAIPYYDERHSVKPGITGWAQVKFGYGSNLEDAEQKLEYDLYYIKHMSWIFDMGIMLYTLKVMVLGRGAR
jgi:sugar transferase (PEP-CTERM system associated)